MAQRAEFYALEKIDTDNAHYTDTVGGFITGGLSQAIADGGSIHKQIITAVVVNAAGALVQQEIEVEFESFDGQTGAVKYKNLETEVENQELVLEAGITAVASVGLQAVLGLIGLTPIGLMGVVVGTVAGGTVSWLYNEYLEEDANQLFDFIQTNPQASMVLLDAEGNQVAGGIFRDGLSSHQEITFAIDGANGLIQEAATVEGFPALEPGMQIKFYDLTGFGDGILRNSYTIENGDVIVEIANSFGKSVDEFLNFAHDPVASDGYANRPFTAHFTDGNNAYDYSLFIAGSDGDNYLFTRPNDMLSIDMDGKFFTPRVDFLLADLIQGSGDIVGNAANNIILGSDNADDLSGAGGADLLLAGDGEDYIHGGAGDDSLFGGADADRFVASAGNDFVGDYNFAEGDILQFNNTTEIDGLSFGKVSDNLTITIDGGSGFILDSALTGAIGSGSQTIDLRLDLDGKLFEASLNYDLSIASVKQLATDGDDVLTGSDDPDQPDEMDGLAGDDVLNARDGNDTLTGGIDNDILTGGAGRDSFIFASGDGDDVITDYTLSEADFLHLTDVANEGDLSTRRVATDGTTDEDGTDLEITYGSGDSIQLNDFYDTQEGPVRTLMIQFADEDAAQPVHINEDGSLLDAGSLDDIAPESGDPGGTEILGTPEADLLTGDEQDNFIFGFEGGFIYSDSRLLDLGVSI